MGHVSTIPHAISDSIWLRRGTLLIGAGHVMLLYGRKKPIRGEKEDPGLFESVARFNGPLDDFHPQMILQCLLWGKISHPQIRKYYSHGLLQRKSSW